MNMLIATLLVHSGQITSLSNLGGWMIELNALYLFGSIAIIFFGAGKFALSKDDSMLN